MFGTFRFFLAWCVVYSHLWKGVHYTGVYAVFAFYLLSGYLMARVLNSRYDFDFNGLRRFFLNRFLRIYPPYLFILLLTLFITYFQSESSRIVNSTLIFPDIRELLYNISIFGVPSVTPKLIPPAWSLKVELIYYILLALIIARRKSICLSFLICSILYTSFMLLNDYDWSHRYAPLSAASLPFCLGASVYFFRNELSFIEFRYAKYIAVLFAINMLFSKFLFGNPFYYGYYLSLVLACFLMISLSRARKDINSFIMNADTLLGNLSYPVFLCHYFAGCLVISFGLADDLGGQLFFYSIIPICLLSYISYIYVEKPVNYIRDKVRQDTPKNQRMSV